MSSSNKARINIITENTELEARMNMKLDVFKTEIKADLKKNTQLS